MIQEAWLIFTPIKGPYWSKKWVKKDFVHVYLLGRDKFNWYFFNFDERMMGFKILPNSRDDDLVTKYRNKDQKIIYVKFNQMNHKNFKKKDGFMIWRGFTCVELVKYFIGFKCFAWTPYQLYRKLIKASKSKRPDHIFEIKEI